MINIQRSKNAFAPIFKAPKSKKVAVRAEHKPVKPSKNSLTALSLFSGGGGLDLAAHGLALTILEFLKGAKESSSIISCIIYNSPELFK